MGLGLALVLVGSPAMADLGEPVHVAAPVSVAAGYRYFEPRGNAQTPGAYWNPCDTITYGIDFRQAVKRGLTGSNEKQRWQSVLSEVGRLSGLRFRYIGQIRTKPVRGRPTSSSRADIIITYGTARGYGKKLAGSIAGVAGVFWQSSQFPRRKQVTSGYVVIDAAEIIRSISTWQVPFDARPASQRNPDMIRALYMHEFGHAVGLQHVKDRSQLMYPTLSASRPDTWGSGDRIGLRKLGQQRCF